MGKALIGRYTSAVYIHERFEAELTFCKYCATHKFYSAGFFLNSAPACNCHVTAQVTRRMFWRRTKRSVRFSARIKREDFAYTRQLPPQNSWLLLMSATIAIAQLGSVVRDLEAYLAVLNDITCTKDELMELDALGAKLADAATSVQKKTGSFRLPHERLGWAASAELRSQAQSTVRSLTLDGKLERPVLFRRNITMIFTGPKDSEFDSEDMKSRKAVTRQRCKRIRELSPDGVVAWAASYTPTSWAAGCMGKDVFECLVDDVELLAAQNWPSVIQETVQKLQNEKALQDSVEFAGFINGESLVLQEGKS